MRSMRVFRGWLPLAVVGMLLPAVAYGDLVVLHGGDVVKVVRYEVGAHKARLYLPSGGTLTLSVLRIERIVADEVDTTPVPPAKDLRLTFAADQGVPDGPYGTLIYAAARRHGINPRLVAEMVRAESGFVPNALSKKGARGLMQLMPATAARFGVAQAELFDPARNLEAGVRYLRWLVDRFGEDAVRVLAAYNAGEGTVERFGGVPPYRETRTYVRRILASLGQDGAAASAVAASADKSRS